MHTATSAAVSPFANSTHAQKPIRCPPSASGSGPVGWSDTPAHDITLLSLPNYSLSPFRFCCLVAIVQCRMCRRWFISKLVSPFALRSIASSSRPRAHLRALHRIFLPHHALRCSSPLPSRHPFPPVRSRKLSPPCCSIVSSSPCFLDRHAQPLLPLRNQRDIREYSSLEFSMTAR
jgi:hypothetical protein